MSTIVILLILILIAIYFIHLQRKRPEQKEIYYALILLIIIFSAIYSVKVLDIRIGGNTLSVEEINKTKNEISAEKNKIFAKKVEIEKIEKKILATQEQVNKSQSEINRTQDNLQKVVELNIKMSAILGDGSARWAGSSSGGLMPEYQKQINMYRKQISRLIPINDTRLNQEIERDLNKIHLEMHL